MQKPRLNFWQIWNMSFGFFGIQFGWGLQMANMSAIYEYLGAKPDQIPLLWLAAPLTGLIVQPIIGYMSDRTWGRLGRRRPYFLAGAILSSLALLAMPNSPTLWMAAGLLWVLDASINISMEPFRAFVADMLPEEQRTVGFGMQSLLIGLGAIVASSLPFILSQGFHVANVSTAEQRIPPTVKYSFYLGAGVFLCAVLWTIFKTKEYPPEQLGALPPKSHGMIAEIFDAIAHMPKTMRQLAWVQIFTWLGLFCMWLYFGPAIARTVFNAPDETSKLYSEGIEWGGICFSVYSAVTFAFSFVLVSAARRWSRKLIHGACLICGAAGLLSVAVIHSKYLLLLSMAGIGIAWASILSMPYAMLSTALPPARIGIYMGIFNFFIVLPEIFQSLTFGWVMKNILHNNRLAAVVAGGIFFLVAAVLTQTVDDPVPEREEKRLERATVAG
jgi:maltose/moltooligosaccharide transporter